MHGDVDDVEAGMAGAHLHGDFGALLLLGNLLGADLDTGEFLELLLVRLQHVAARGLGEVDFELGPLGLLPVECALGVGTLDDGGGAQDGGRGGQQGAAADHAGPPKRPHWGLSWERELT